MIRTAAASRRPGHGSSSDMTTFGRQAHPRSIMLFLAITQIRRTHTKTCECCKSEPEKAHQHRLTNHTVKYLVEEVIREGLGAPQSDRERRTSQSKGGTYPVAKPVHDHSRYNQ